MLQPSILVYTISFLEIINIPSVLSNIRTAYNIYKEVLNMYTNCQICGVFLRTSNVSKAHAGLCKDCYAAVTRYKRYLKAVDKSEEQIHFIREMNKVFVINEINGKYVPKAYYTEGRWV